MSVFGGLCEQGSQTNVHTLTPRMGLEKLPDGNFQQLVEELIRSCKVAAKRPRDKETEDLIHASCN